MERILLIEDDAPLAIGIVYTLSEEGWDVDHAATVKQARELLSLHVYDLVVLDVMLPDGNGFALCREIRRASGVPVIFLTACDEEVNVVLGLDMGGDDYLTKPFRVREFVSRIRAVLRRLGGPISSATSKNRIHSGDIHVHRMERRVFKSERELILTQTEFRLLMLLLENPQRPLSREQLLQGLWDIEGDFIDDNTLSVYIRRLREKLEDHPASPEFIVTVRGFGYKWMKEVV